MANIETPVSQLKINELTKTEFDNASTLSETELYAVDPEFTGGKLLKTDSNGDIVESTATEADAVAGGTAVQGVQVNNVDLTPDANKKVNVQVPTNTNQLTNGAGFITSSYHDDTKLDKPAGGTVGQVLTKTETGEEWSEPSGGITARYDENNERIVFE